MLESKRDLKEVVHRRFTYVNGYVYGKLRRRLMCLQAYIYLYLSCITIHLDAARLKYQLGSK